MQIQPQEIAAWWGAIVATIALSWNVLKELRVQRVRIKVIPKSAEFYPNGVRTSSELFLEGDHFCIEVINLSLFTIVISEVGFVLPGGLRGSIPRPILRDGEDFPRRVSSRESFSVYMIRSAIPADVGKAYARTDCEVIRYGDSAALRSLRERRRGN